jgi:hypothetical protein
MNCRKTLGSLVLVSSMSLAATAAFADTTPGERLDNALDQTGQALDKGADKTGDALEKTLDKTGDIFSRDGNSRNSVVADRLRDASDRAQDRAHDRADNRAENRERLIDRFDMRDRMDRMDRSSERRGLLGR